MNAESDLFSWMYAEVDKFKMDICSSCGISQLLIRHLVPCGHSVCNECLKSTVKKCPVCKSKRSGEYPLDEDNMSVLLSHIGRLKSISEDKGSNDCGNLEIQVKFISDLSSSKQDCKGETPLHKECRSKKSNNAANVKAHLEAGIDVNAQDFAGWTALHEAVVAGQVEIVKILLEYGALVNVPGLNYNTPLHCAVQEKNINLVKLLIEYGANLMSFNRDGKTPLDFCYDDDTMAAICLTNRRPQITKIYTVPSPKVFYVNVKDADMAKINQYSVKVATTNNLLSVGDVTYVILGNDNPNTLHLQAALLQGACVVTLEWLQEFANQGYMQYPLNYLADLPGFALRKAAMNKFNKLPKLLDGIRFYFCHSNKQKIGGCEYTVQDLKKLVELGGGKVITRFPIRHLEQDIYYPYHLPKVFNMATTTYYLIYDETREMELGKIYNYLEMKHKSARWLIQCINNFDIVD